MNMGYCEFNEKAYLYKKYDASMKNNIKDYVRQSYRNDETFDHEDGIFFTNDYQNVTQWQIRSEGTTNYSSPLKLVLDEFENQFNWYDHRPSNNNNMMYGRSNNSNNNSHIVLLTDGVPTEGDLKCKERSEGQLNSVLVYIPFLLIQFGPLMYEECHQKAKVNKVVRTQLF